MSKFIIVTPMKNEGPFLMEWVAHNLAIGADEIVVFSNDCTDGTDELLDRLSAIGKVRHFENSSRAPSPQRHAYRRFMKMDLAGDQDWVVPIDADEFINIKTGDNTFGALTARVPDARTISMTWKLFGNNGVRSYENSFVTDQFRMAAPARRRPSFIAWGFKTMFQRGLWDTIGVHRPKFPRVETFDETAWVNGSGQPMPERYMYRHWRSFRDTVGYDLVQVNHYAVKSCESYLVKKARGRAHRHGQELGLDYWHRMNYNDEQDRSIDAVSPAKAAIHKELLDDSELRRLHEASCARHREMIAELRARPDFDALLQALLPAVP